MESSPFCLESSMGKGNVFDHVTTLSTGFGGGYSPRPLSSNAKFIPLSFPVLSSQKERLELFLNACLRRLSLAICCTLVCV